MGVEAVIATQVIDTTSVGRSLMTAADAAAARTAIGAGTSSFNGAYSSLSGIPSTFAPSTHSHTTADITGFGEAVDDEVATLLTAGTNITITYNDAANTLTIASTASGLSGTGSVDNAALRADGTGGATLQNSAWIINDNLTASPNNTVNHACFEATGGTTNVSVSIKPKGTGAFCLAAPDGTVTGGNVRGANCIDLQTYRGAASQVASGNYSVVIGSYNIASGNYSRAIGHGNTASGDTSVAIGHSCTASTADSYAIGSSSIASGGNSVAIGNSNTASNNTSVAIGASNIVSGNTSTAIGNSCQTTGWRSVALGYLALADRRGQVAFSTNAFAALGDCQLVSFSVSNKTTNSTPTTLYADGTGATARLTVPSGKVMFADVLILGAKSDGSAVACYKRKVAIKNVGGTTSLVGSVETIGTDIEDSAGCDVSITADNTNDALQINVTGIAAETWRWHAVVDGVEIAYGT